MIEIEEVIEGTVQHSQPTYDLMPEVIRPEVNFLRYPFFALSWYGLKKKNAIEYVSIEERNGEKTEFRWLVQGGSKYGIPNPYDRKVARAIDAVVDEVADHNGYPVENPIPFSIYQLAGWVRGSRSRDGRTYRRIKESLERLAATTVKSSGSFFLKDEQKWLEDIFHPYERVVFAGKKTPDGEIAETNLLWLGEPYIRNINAHNTRPLDYQFLKKLKYDMTSRFYEILSEKFYACQKDGRNYWHIGYQNLCQLLPIAPQKQFSSAKRRLQPAHEELGETGYISKVVYYLHRDRKEISSIRYYIGERAKAEIAKGFGRPYPLAIEEETFTEQKSEPAPLPDLAQELTNRDVSRSKALKLVQNHDESRITSKIANFDLLQAIEPLDNPAGWLISSIEDDYELTDKQKDLIKSESQRRETEKLETHAQTIADQRIQAVLKTFPTKDQWVENRVTEAKRIRSLLVKQNPKFQPFSDQELEKFKETAIADYPNTQEEQFAYIKRNLHQYNADPDDIIKELGQQA